MVVVKGAVALPAQGVCQDCRRLVRHHVIDIPARAVERTPASVHLGGVRHLLRSPGLPLLAPFPVMARRPAHGENGRAVDIEYLTAHQMQDVWAHNMDVPAAPLGLGEFCQHAMVLVVPVNEACGPGLGLEPIEPVAVRA